jgi:protein-S-isoprenylcysteine O-methyltransferase Ste14
MKAALPFCIRAAWITVGLVWAVAAMSVKRTVRAEPLDSRIGHIMTFAVAFTLLFSSRMRIGPLAWPVFLSSEISAAAGLALTIGGIVFAIWARLYLGGNWSAAVAIKQHHTLLRTGPYAIVRHPIYAGLLLAMFGTAIEVTELGGFLAVILAFAAWLAKARLEESFLLAQFGDTYLHYRQQVKALVPFVM